MSGLLKSVTSKTKVKLGSKKIAIVVADWNKEITDSLYEGAVHGLKAAGLKKRNIVRITVPGTFELTLGAQRMAQKRNIAAVIC